MTVFAGSYHMLGRHYTRAAGRGNDLTAPLGRRYIAGRVSRFENPSLPADESEPPRSQAAWRAAATGRAALEALPGRTHRRCRPALSWRCPLPGARRPDPGLSVVASPLPALDQVQVRDGRGRRHAGALQNQGVILLPRWSRRERVILHELAHLATPSSFAPHGPEYAAVYLELVQHFMGAAAAGGLGGSFRTHRVRSGTPAT